MQSLRTILPKVLHRRGLHAQAKASLVTYAAQQWLQSALPAFIHMVRAEKLSHATLSISCTHGVAAQECSPLLPLLQDYLQKTFDNVVVREIRIVRTRT